jgi:hypothetical protein
MSSINYDALAKWEDGGVDGSIRITPMGQPSVFDMIKVLGGQKAPHKAWERLTGSHPEVLTKCQNLRFPGPGQRETPVAKDKEAAYYILGLLPGAVGKKYREDAAQVFVQALDDPAALVEKLIPRLTKEELDWHEARLSGKRDRKEFTSTLKRAGVSQNAYGDCTNAIYLPVLGAKASTLKKLAVIKHKERTGRLVKTSSITVRDHLSVDELDRLRTAEQTCGGQLKALAARLEGQPGSAVRDKHVEHIVSTTARYVEGLRKGDVIVPGLC